MALQSPGLIKAANDALVGISGDINIARLFATDLSDDFAEYGDTVKVMVATATAGELNLDPGQGETLNDYETDSGNVTPVSVVLNHQPKATMAAPRASAFEAPNAPYWGKCSQAMIDAIDGSISTVLGGLFTTTACTGGKVVCATGGKADVAKITASCKGRVSRTVLALEPVYFATLLGDLDAHVYGGDEAIRQGIIRGLYGFKGVIALRDLPTGVKGALIPDTSVVVAARKTLKDESGFIEAGTVMDENGFPITVTRHLSPAKRKEFLNADVLWGAKLVQPAKVQYIAAS
jgi:hypothetical protein